MASRSYSSRLAALEARFGTPSPALIDRAAAALERLEAKDPGGAASAIRGMGYATRLPGIVAESEAHAQAHRAGTPCNRCNSDNLEVN